MVLYQPTVTPSQRAFHQRRVAAQQAVASAAEQRIERAWRKPEPAPVAIEPLPPQRQRREYETRKTPPRDLPLITRVLRIVADDYLIQPSDITGPSRRANIVQARHVTVGLLIDLTKASLPTIGRLVGRDHTTIINSQKQFAVLMQDELFRARIEQIKEALR